MQIIADLHTHTNVTDHAFSTLTEMVQAAEDRGLAAIAITNHGPTNPDGPHEWHFSNLDLIPRKIGKVTVIRGIEFDITAPAGGINVISNKSLKPIEFALASFHECMFPPVDSDSHICYRVGHVEGALEMLEEIGFPEELIINSSVERLNNYFKGRGLHLFDEEDLL